MAVCKPIHFPKDSSSLRSSSAFWQVTRAGVHIRVAETNKVDLVIEEGVLPSLDEDHIRDGLANSADQVTRGDEAMWDPADIKAAGRALLAEQNPCK